MKRLLSSAVLALTAGGALAQDAYPSRAITIIVPNPPGGMNQLTAQPLSAVIEKLTKQPAPVINKPGATATLGTAYVANQKPDGYHILVTTPNLYLALEKNKALNIESPYRLEQIQPLALTSADPVIMVVQVQSPYKTAKDFVADAKAKEGQLAYATSGPYGITHLPFAMLEHAAGIKMRHVPTTGGGPALTALLGGHVQATGGGVATTLAHVKGGKMRALASWGAKRHPNMPDVPTFKEQGYDVEAYLWVGLFTTAGLPEPTFKAMRDLLRRTLNDPLYKQAMQKANVVIDYRDTPEFTAFFKEDHKRLGAAVHRIAAEEKKK